MSLRSAAVVFFLLVFAPTASSAEEWTVYRCRSGRTLLVPGSVEVQDLSARCVCPLAPRADRAASERELRRWTKAVRAEIVDAPHGSGRAAPKSQYALAADP